MSAQLIQVLRVFLRWCLDQDLDPLAAVRVDIERYVRWLQDRLTIWATSWFATVTDGKGAEVPGGRNRPSAANE